MLLRQSNGFSAFLFGLITLSCLSVAAQTPDAHPQKAKPPAQLLHEAAAVNGLLGDDLKPWHLKVTYSFLDGAGKTVEQGTLEETWAGPKRDKLVVRRPQETLTYIRSENGIYREGELDRQLALLLLVEKAFVEPAPSNKAWWSYIDITPQQRRIGASTIPCFTLKGGDGEFSSYNDPTYCLEGNEPIFRVSSFVNDRHQFTRNSMGKFQGRFVPVDLIAGSGEKPDLTAHLDTLKEVSNFDANEFEPGPHAVLQRVSKTALIFPEGAFDSMIDTHHLHLVKSPKPEYPAIAQAAHIRGHVVLRVMIDADGEVASANVVRGPEMLQEAALDAVWKWKFEPPVSEMGPARIIAIIDMSF